MFTPEKLRGGAFSDPIAFGMACLSDYKQRRNAPGFPEILHLKTAGWPSFIVWSVSGCMTVGAWSAEACAGTLAGPLLLGAVTTHSASQRASPAELIATHSYCPLSSELVSMINSVYVLSSSSILYRMSGIIFLPFC